jgi:hypothetical protein
MFVAKVTGSLISTQKVASMKGFKLLVVEPYRVEDAWVPDAGARMRQLQAIFEQGRVEEFGMTCVDEEIDVFCSRERLFKADIAFPVTVANAFLLQRFEEAPDGCLVRDGWSRVIQLYRYSFSR